MSQPASLDRDLRDRNNLRLGLLLATVALAFFFGYILQAWWLK